MKPFRPGHKTAELILSARKDGIDRSPQLNVTSHRYSNGGKVDFEILEEAIGERVIRLLGTVARRAVTRKPGLDRVLVITRCGFVPEVEEGLQQRLGVSQEVTGYRNALMLLAEDLFMWGRNEPSARECFGLQVDEESGEVHVACPDLTPVVTPLKH